MFLPWGLLFLSFNSNASKLDGLVSPSIVLPLCLFSACTVTQRKIKMQTIQYRRTRIWEMKKDIYTKTLAKNQVCEIFQMREIGKNGLPKFIKLCMETQQKHLFSSFPANA